MRAVIIFTLLFYSLIGYFINILPTSPEAGNFNLITEELIEERVKVTATEAPSVKNAAVAAANNLYAVVKTIYLLLSFQLSGVPFIVSLLFLVPANITIYMVSVQLIRGYLQ